jgi:hypothetical protein
VLRVPRHQLELLVGGPLDDVDEQPAPPTAPTHHRNTNKHNQPGNQPQLFNPNPATTH